MGNNRRLPQSNKGKGIRNKCNQNVNAVIKNRKRGELNASPLVLKPNHKGNKGFKGNQDIKLVNRSGNPANTTAEKKVVEENKVLLHNKSVASEPLNLERAMNKLVCSNEWVASTSTNQKIGGNKLLGPNKLLGTNKNFACALMSQKRAQNKFTYPIDSQKQHLTKYSFTCPNKSTFSTSIDQECTPKKLIYSNESLFVAPILAPQNGIKIPKIQTSLNDILKKVKKIHVPSIHTFDFDEPDVTYSRKVFIGGLPSDINERQIEMTFSCFGQVSVDWPNKHKFKLDFPSNGFGFLIFESSNNVKHLISKCRLEDNKLNLLISSTTVKNRPVEIRPWNISDTEFTKNHHPRTLHDFRKTIFVGGIPRRMKAIELAKAMDRLYGGVCNVTIDTDILFDYPRGTGRIVFDNQNSFMTSITDHFIEVNHDNLIKQIELKPYVVFDQMCDLCEGLYCDGKLAQLFCADRMCLKYLCHYCWKIVHSQKGRDFHKPFMNENSLQ